MQGRLARKTGGDWAFIAWSKQALSRRGDFLNDCQCHPRGARGGIEAVRNKSELDFVRAAAGRGATFKVRGQLEGSYL